MLAASRPAGRKGSLRDALLWSQQYAICHDRTRRECFFSFGPTRLRPQNECKRTRCRALLLQAYNSKSYQCNMTCSVALAFGIAQLSAVGNHRFCGAAVVLTLPWIGKTCPPDMHVFYPPTLLTGTDRQENKGLTLTLWAVRATASTARQLRGM